jgi:hypothetical protein
MSGVLSLGPVRFVEAKTLFWLICCKKKKLFQLKKQAKNEL